MPPVLHLRSPPRVLLRSARACAWGLAAVVLLVECHLGDLFDPGRPFADPAHPPGLASQVAIAAGDGQTATAGTAVAIPPAVIARDSSGNPVAGVSVTFTVRSGGGAVMPAAPVTTDSAGIAAATSWTLGASSGVDSLQATASGLAGSPLTFTATATAPTSGPSPATSVVSVSSASVASGATATLTLQARDSAGADLTTGGATVVFTASGGTSAGTIGATTDHANGTYTATFTAMAAGTATTIGATINGAGVTSPLPTLTVTPGPVSGSTSTVAAAPASIQAGSGSSTITVTARDAAGNPISGATVTLAASGSGNTLTQPAGPTSASGVATGTLSSSVPETKAVSATINGVAVAQTAAVTVVVGTVSGSNSTVVAAPTTIPAGSGSSTITVTAKDALGNPISGATVVLAATGSGNTLTQPTGTTNASGVATGRLSSTVAESKTVSATINGVAIAQTATVAVAPGAVSTSQSLVTVSSSTVAVGGTVTLTLQAKDGFGNNLTTGGLTVVFSQTSGASLGTISGTTDHGNGTYTATFTAVTPGTATFSATINGQPVTSPSPTITVTL